jgi:hypothetical protein
MKENLFKGTYSYLKNGGEYSRENFEISKEEITNGNIYYQSEILTRVSTGEFLKVYVDYEVTAKYDPVMVKIVKSLGAKKTVEKYHFNDKSRTLYYTFEAEGKSNEAEKVIQQKFQIMTPAFLTSMLPAMNKKVDLLGRTSMTIINSPNIWDWQGGFHENQLHMEIESTESVVLKIGENELNSTLIYIYEHEKGVVDGEQGVPCYLSRHYGAPYMATYPDDTQIKVLTFKNTQSKYKGQF